MRRIGGVSISALGTDREQTFHAWSGDGPVFLPPILGEGALETVLGAPRPSRLPRPAVRDTSRVCLVSLLYEVSSPGAGTDRSHAPGCRYNVLTSCMRPCWQTGHTAPGSPADTSGVLRSTATSRGWGCVACPRRVRHCASFSCRTRLAKKPK